VNGSTTVAAELELRLVVPGHAAVPVTASLCYRRDDPYAIQMAFHVGTDEPVQWAFGRDLLAAGLEQHTGEGDVRLWPSNALFRSVLNISLSSPHGQAHFEAPLAPMRSFLLRTYDILPAGGEGGLADIDGELDQMLGRA
jgi:hypothetical protein